MKNEPNSVPLKILSDGETMTHFMKRVENKRGLSMIKSGIEHIQIRFSTKTNKKVNSKKKS